MYVLDWLMAMMSKAWTADKEIMIQQKLDQVQGTSCRICPVYACKIHQVWSDIFYGSLHRVSCYSFIKTCLLASLPGMVETYAVAAVVVATVLGMAGTIDIWH